MCFLSIAYILIFNHRFLIVVNYLYICIMSDINYKQPIYGFILNCEYHIITRLSSKKYGVVPLFTDSYGIEEVESDSLEETIKLCKKLRWNIKEFKSYMELFEWGFIEEEKLASMDLWGVSDITGRHCYIEDNEDVLKDNINKKLGL